MFRTKLQLTNYGVREFGRKPYVLHQRLCAAFEDGKHHSCVRSEDEGFLWAVFGNAVFIQSADKPDIQKAFMQSTGVLAAEPKIHEFQFNYQEGDVRKFALKATLEQKNEQGKKVPLPFNQAHSWFLKRMSGWGIQAEFEVEKLNKASSIKYDREYSVKRDITFSPCLFKGDLIIRDPSKFRKQLVSGFGAKKSMGCSLMLLSNDWDF